MKIKVSQLRRIIREAVKSAIEKDYEFCPQCGTEGEEPETCSVCAEGEPCPRCGMYNPSGTTDDCVNCHGIYDDDDYDAPKEDPAKRDLLVQKIMDEYPEGEIVKFITSHEQGIGYHPSNIGNNLKNFVRKLPPDELSDLHKLLSKKHSSR